MLLPIVGFCIFVVICVLLAITGIFVLTYAQSHYGLARSKLSFALFIVGGLVAGISAAAAYIAIGRRYLSEVVSIIFNWFGPHLTTAVIVLTFLVVIAVAAIAGGVFIVWLGDLLISQQQPD